MRKKELIKPQSTSNKSYINYSNPIKEYCNYSFIVSSSQNERRSLLSERGALLNENSIDYAKKVEQSRTEQSRTEQSRTEQSRAEQSRTEQSRAEQSRNLPKILKQELVNSFRGEGGRAQSGFFHVWFRGNNRYNVFYNDEDFIGFLKRCNIASAKHNSAITAFVIMNNHVHLQVYSNNLTLFITSILITFSRWLNRRKNLRGKLFESPFRSHQLFTEEAVKRNMLYIITNPISAGICTHLNDYKWSSYHFLKKRDYNDLINYIKIDTGIMEGFFGSINGISLAAQNYLIIKHNYTTQLVSSKSGSPKNKINSKEFYKRPKENNRVKLNDSELSIILAKILKNKELCDLSRSELIEIIKILRDEYNATYRQISALTHESYDDVRRMAKKSSIR